MISSVSDEGAIPELCERPVDVLGEFPAVELVGGHVHGDAELEPFRAPCGGLAAGLLEHPAADRDDQPALLGQRDEARGRHDAPLRMAPAHERLDADHPLAGQIEDRLVDQEQLVLLHGRAQIGFEVQATLRVRVQARVVQRVAVLAGGLGRVQGEVGVAQQLIRRGVVADRHADARGDRERLAGVAELDRRAQRLGQAVGEDVRRRLVGRRLDQHDELVSAEPPDGVLVAHRALQPFPRDPQQPVSGRVPEVVVDVLEAVDVDVQSTRHRPRLARRAREHLLGAVEHERAVGQAGERVVERQVGELARLLAHERQRARAPGREHQHQQAEHPAQQDPPDQQRQRVPAVDHARGGGRAEGLHGPAVAERDLRALRAGRRGAAREHDVRVPRFVAEAHGDVRVAFERSRQHHAGLDQLAEPAHERRRRAATVVGVTPPRYTGVSIPSAVPLRPATGA